MRGSPAIAEGGALVAADGGLIGMAVFGPRRARARDPGRDHRPHRAGHQGQGPCRPRLSRGRAAARSARGCRRAAQARRAAMVVTLDPAGPAKAAGILQGDIIVALGGARGDRRAQPLPAARTRHGRAEEGGRADPGGRAHDRRRHRRGASADLTVALRPQPRTAADPRRASRRGSRRAGAYRRRLRGRRHRRRGRG